MRKKKDMTVGHLEDVKRVGQYDIWNVTKTRILSPKFERNLYNEE